MPGRLRQHGQAVMFGHVSVLLSGSFNHFQHYDSANHVKVPVPVKTNMPYKRRPLAVVNPISPIKSNPGTIPHISDFNLVIY